MLLLSMNIFWRSLEFTVLSAFVLCFVEHPQTELGGGVVFKENRVEVG